MILAATRQMPGRCSNGFAACHHPDLCQCDDLTWTIFRTAILAAAGPDRIVHQRNVRPRIRGRVPSKAIGQMYRRAKAEGLILDTGEREPSDDAAGRNLDKLDRIYALGDAA